MASTAHFDRDTGLLKVSTVGKYGVISLHFFHRM